MDTVVDRPWSTETFLAWEDKQEGKHEFDGREVIPMTGGTVAHQKIVSNLLVLLDRVLTGRELWAIHEMRLRIGEKIRYPDVLISDGPMEEVKSTLDNAVVVFEVLSHDTAETDRVEKPIDYANVPSLKYYIMLEQTCRAATVCTRDAAGAWLSKPLTQDAIVIPHLDLVLPLDEIYRGLTFPHR